MHWRVCGHDWRVHRKRRVVERVRAAERRVNHWWRVNATVVRAHLWRDRLTPACLWTSLVVESVDSWVHVELRDQHFSTGHCDLCVVFLRRL